VPVFDESVTRGEPPLDYQLLRGGPITRYYSATVLARHVNWLQEREYEAAWFNATAWADDTACHAGFQARLGFGEGYGRNLNALDDALEDIVIPREGGLALVITGYGGTPSDALLDVVARKARWWLLFGRRLIVLIQSDDPHFTLGKLGATTAPWNPDEWLNSARLAPA
jgi:Barstar (barnase inhibitor)